MRSKEAKVILPLLNALKSMKPDQRIIVMSHLDDRTRDAIYRTIDTVMRSKKVPTVERKLLRERLAPHKETLRYLTNVEKGPVGKKRRLTQIGGAPLDSVLNTAIPLLMDFFPK